MLIFNLCVPMELICNEISESIYQMLIIVTNKQGLTLNTVHVKMYTQFATHNFITEKKMCGDTITYTNSRLRGLRPVSNSQFLK